MIIAGHAFIQNLRRGHYELGVDAPPDSTVSDGRVSASAVTAWVGACGDDDTVLDPAVG